MPARAVAHRSRLISCRHAATRPQCDTGHMASPHFFAFDTRYQRPLTVQSGQHVYLIGATGTGKTTLMRTLVSQDLHERAGFALIDPHGDLVRQIESDGCRSDLLVLDAARDDRLGCNPLKSVAPAWRGLWEMGIRPIYLQNVCSNYTRVRGLPGGKGGKVSGTILIPQGMIPGSLIHFTTSSLIS